MSFPLAELVENAPAYRSQNNNNSEEAKNNNLHFTVAMSKDSQSVAYKALWHGLILSLLLPGCRHALQ